MTTQSTSHTPGPWGLAEGNERLALSVQLSGALMTPATEYRLTALVALGTAIAAGLGLLAIIIL